MSGLYDGDCQLVPPLPVGYTKKLPSGLEFEPGSPEHLAAAFTAGPASALVSASRSVLYADRGAGWQEAAAAEAGRLAGELRAVAAVG